MVKKEHDGDGQSTSGSQQKRNKDVAQRQKLERGSRIRSVEHRYTIHDIIDNGIFGDVYKVEQEVTNKFFTLKTEDADAFKNVSRLRVEALILMSLAELGTDSRKKYFTRLHDRGKIGNLRFIVIDFVGPNLEMLRRTISPEGFSPSTVMFIANKTIQSIWDLHIVGYLHRDIKPSNFAVGQENVEELYMLDFGIARRFISTTKMHRPPRDKVLPFIGTQRYASRTCHRGKEQSRKDDLESWLYMLFDLFDRNCLPWKDTHDKGLILAKKESFFENRYPIVFEKAPRDFKRLMMYVDQLKYDDEPDYDFIRTVLKQAAQVGNIDTDVPPDWKKIKDFQGEWDNDMSDDKKGEGRDNQEELEDEGEELKTTDRSKDDARKTQASREDGRSREKEDTDKISRSKEETKESKTDLNFNIKTPPEKNRSKQLPPKNNADNEYIALNTLALTNSNSALTPPAPTPPTKPKRTLPANPAPTPPTKPKRTLPANAFKKERNRTERTQESRVSTKKASRRKEKSKKRTTSTRSHSRRTQATDESDSDSSSDSRKKAKKKKRRIRSQRDRGR